MQPNTRTAMLFSPFGCIYQPTSPCPTLSAHNEPICKTESQWTVTPQNLKPSPIPVVKELKLHDELCRHWRFELILSHAETYHILLWLQVITKNQRKEILESCHSSGRDASNHFDQKETLAVVSKRYFWPRMEDDVKEFCKACELCKKNKR